MLRSDEKSIGALGAWLFAAAILGPVLILGVGFWRIYFISEALLAAYATGAVMGVVATGLLVRRAKVLADHGGHPYLRFGERLAFQQVVKVLLGLWFVCCGWVLVTMAVWPWLSGATVQTKAFKVSEVTHCTRKCLGCGQEVKLQAWDGYPGAKLCGDGVAPPLASGDDMLVRGRFSAVAILVEGVDASPARKATFLKPASQGLHSGNGSSSQN